MSRLLFKAIILIAAMLLCCSCARSVDPGIPYGLLLKCRDFLAFCCFLAEQEKPYYNHLAGKYYYAMLSLALITYQWQKGKGSTFKVLKKHEDVWQLMPHDVKRTYGGELKSLRTKCDYSVLEKDRDMRLFKTKLSPIICDENGVFDKLELKATTDYRKFFDIGINDAPISIGECDSLIKEVRDLQHSLKEQMIRK